MIEALDHVTPGIANEHTLLYGVEAKFYSARPKVREGFESEIDGSVCRWRWCWTNTWIGSGRS